MEGVELVYSQEDIQEAINSLGEKLNKELENSKDPVLAVCVLKGAFMFFSDLMKVCKFSPMVDFIRVSSYGNSHAPEGDVILKKDTDIDPKGKHVILIEDIIDRGHSITFLRKHFESKGVAKLTIITLINKTAYREVEETVDYSCFTLSSGFLIGYGLDSAEQYRELPAIYSVNTSN